MRSEDEQWERRWRKDVRLLLAALVVLQIAGVSLLFVGLD